MTVTIKTVIRLCRNIIVVRKDLLLRLPILQAFYAGDAQRACARTHSPYVCTGLWLQLRQRTISTVIIIQRWKLGQECWYRALLPLSVLLDFGFALSISLVQGRECTG